MSAGFFNYLLNNTEQAAAGLFDSLAEAFFGKPNSLRDGSEHAPVSLPRDLAAHDDVQTEWWYYTGHAVTESGREFGFELVFFKRRTDLDRFSVVPLRLIGNPFYFAHFAVTGHSTRSFRYAHRKSANGLLDLPASADTHRYDLKLGDWSAREADAMHLLHANIDSDITFDAALKPSKRVVLNGEGGVSFKDKGEASRYFSYTRMAMEGEIIIDGSVERFTGTAWMDREFGTWTPTDNQKGWDWFSIQLDNDCELMCYQLRNGKGLPSPFSSGTFVYADGRTVRLAAEDFNIRPIDKWKSPKTGAVYPSGWSIEVLGLEISIQVTPVILDQELDTRGTTMIVYWEGSSRVTGEAMGKKVGGNAYVELVGYDRSHDKPNLAHFLMGDSLGFISNLLE